MSSRRGNWRKWRFRTFRYAGSRNNSQEKCIRVTEFFSSVFRTLYRPIAVSLRERGGLSLALTEAIGGTFSAPCPGLFPARHACEAGCDQYDAPSKLSKEQISPAQLVAAQSLATGPLDCLPLQQVGRFQMQELIERRAIPRALNQSDGMKSEHIDSDQPAG